MLLNKKTVRDIDVQGKRVLIRCDFNVPLDGGQITDDRRVTEALPTTRYVVDHGGIVILASHLGRPKGVSPELSLAPVAKRLSELLGKPVPLLGDCVGEAVREAVGKAQAGDVLLLENVRFHPEEEKNDPEFSKKLAALCDVYVNDAFGSAHRAHASTVGMIQYVPQAAAGLLMDKELEYLNKVTKNPERPSVAILGGAKVSDKIEVIENLMKVVDQLLIGGAMAYTFMRAQGKPIGKSLVENDKVELAKELLQRANGKIHLPLDHVVAAELKEGAANEVVETIPDGEMGLDIGPKTIEEFKSIIHSAKTIIWNGPMGVFEKPPFDKGTVALAKAVAESGAVSVVGGGDSEKAIKSAGVTDKISHVSTGGGASLEFLSGIELPGVAALTDK